jgi:hypothetical protein
VVFLLPLVDLVFSEHRGRLEDSVPFESMGSLFMNRFLLPSALLSLVLAPSLLASEGNGFDNYLLSSPSIISPSQLYQVKKTRGEATLLLLSGSFETKALGADSKVDVSGTGLGLGLALPLAGGRIVGALDITQVTQKNEGEGGEGDKSSELDLAPAISFSVTPNLSVGVKASIVSGQEKEEATEAEDVGYNYVTVGATFHVNQFEASFAYANENKDEKHPQNNRPSTLNLHGRYRLVPEIAAGVRYEQEKYSSLNNNVEDADSLYLIVEAYLEGVTAEASFGSLSSFGGAKDSDATSLGLIAQFHLSSAVQVGGTLGYLTLNSDTVEYSLVRMGVIGTVHF